MKQNNNKKYKIDCINVRFTDGSVECYTNIIKETWMDEVGLYVIVQKRTDSEGIIENKIRIPQISNINVMCFDDECDTFKKDSPVPPSTDTIDTKYTIRRFGEGK